MDTEWERLRSARENVWGSKTSCKQDGENYVTRGAIIYVIYKILSALPKYGSWDGRHLHYKIFILNSIKVAMKGVETRSTLEFVKFQYNTVLTGLSFESMDVPSLIFFFLLFKVTKYL
jgi:hypothetical protein